MRSTFQIHGHRGARGVFPENTIPSFHYCLQNEILFIELDVVISKDRVVVVSHDTFFDSVFCEVPHDLPNNLFSLNYDQISQIDSGLKFHSGFSQQKKVAAYKPTLKETLLCFLQFQKTKTKVNLEIKSESHLYGKEQPYPDEMVDLVLKEIQPFTSRLDFMIQSFDVNILGELDKKYSGEISYLVENQYSFEENMNKLTFIPTYYNPEDILVTEDLVLKVHSKSMKIIPWTVNLPENAVLLYEMGVDGLISDYPVHIKRYLEAFTD